MTSPSPTDRLQLAGCRIDLRLRTVEPPLAAARLTTREVALLGYLAARAGQDISRDELLVQVWGYREGVVSRTVDTMLQRLRKKVERDPGQPEHLLTIQGVGYRFEPLRSDGSVPHPDGLVVTGEHPRVLPEPANSFVGRGEDLARLDRTFEDGARLVTLLGPGGAGKTRLARRFGARPGDRRVWFCDLADATDAGGVLSILTTSLGIPPVTDDPIAQAGRALAGRGPALVILDNFEQVVEAASATVGRWVAAAPEANFLVTSRERLGLSGERTMNVGPLDDPDAVQLFCDRAVASRPGYVLDEAGRAHVTELCRKLDGLPLAIELAAARVTLLSPEGLVNRLSERFRLLRSSRADLPVRHRTLRATIGWSWDLLDDAERAVLAWCSVFEGGFGAGAAEEVIQLDDPDVWVLDALDALRDKSLLRSIEPDDPRAEVRLHMLESVREFAGEQLDARGDRHRAEARHRACFVAATHGWEHVAGASLAASLRWRAEERANLSAALRRLTAAPPGSETELDEARVRLALGLHPLLMLRGPFDTHLAMLDDAVTASAGLAVEWKARCLLARCAVRRLRGNPGGADEDVAAALPLAEQDGRPALVAEALHLRGVIDVQQGRPGDGEKRYADAIELAASARLQGLEMQVRYSLVLLRRDQGRLDEAFAGYQEVLVMARRLGDRRQEGLALGGLGLLAVGRGQTAEATRLTSESLQIHRERGDRRSLAVAQGNLAMVHAHTGAVAEAEAAYDEARASARDVGDRRLEAMLLRNLAIIRLSRGKVGPSETDFHEALMLHRAMDDRWQEGRCLAELAEVMVDQDRLADAESAYRGGLDIARELGDAHGAAVIEANLGVLLHLTGDLDGAAEFSERALARLGVLNDAWFRGYYLAYGGALRAARGEVGRAEEMLSESEPALRSLQDPAAYALYELCRGVLLAVRSRAAAAAGRAAEADALRTEATDLAAARPEDTTSHAVRVARRLLLEALRAS